MKVAQLAVLGVAVIASGGAFVVANNLSGTEAPVREVVRAAPQIDLTEVLVATQDIPLGTSMKAEMVEWQKWPSQGVAVGFIQKSKFPDGLNVENEPAIARSAFFVGEPIRESKIARAGKGYMSAILPRGQRAIATPISTTSSAGGFILPNDRVDVIMIRREDSQEEEIYITETVLENVRVLAIDQTIEEKEGKAVVVGSTATLQLTLEQAKILTVAQQLADRLSLALRSLEDNEKEVTKAADYLLSDNIEKGRISIIKYGKRKDIITEPANEQK